MKKIFTLVIAFSLSIPGFAQLEDRFGFLNQSEVEKYVQPLGTSLGMAFNSASYYSAKVPDLFGFSISFRGMFIIIPDADKTFTPEIDVPGYSTETPTATVYGGEGTAYYGPDGYIPYPPGIDRSTLPFALPQVSVSLMGTEVMLRYLPSIQLGDEEDLSMFGFGIKHNISRYIPLVPVDIAVQFLYNNLEVTNVMNLTAYAFNAHASKTFGVFTAYGGLQYETSSFDIEYTYTDPSGLNPNLNGTKIKADIEGDNNFRFTFGGALKLAVIVINADLGIGSQLVASSGLTFEF
jgi:hypothetical protein